MPELYDVAAIGNAIVDVIGPATDAFLGEHGLSKGAMMLVDADQSAALYARMTPEIQASGGSAANTIAGLTSFGGRGAFMGKVADDALGQLFAEDMRRNGALFPNAPLVGGAPTAVSMINVTPDAQRTMCTFLGASVCFTDDDVDKDVIEASKVVYLEGYLFDADDARQAFAKAAALAHGSGRKIALTLSDGFVVERHRAGLLGFIETQVDILFGNESEVCALTQAPTFDAAVEALRPRVSLAAITRAEKGSIILSDGERLSVAAEPVASIVDSTGAGDQYAAGFLFGLARGRPLQQCGKLGSLAAAEVISHYGPRPQVSLADLAASKGY